MRIVLDTNRIIASLIRKGKSREILLNEKFEFVTPSYALSEIDKYKDEIVRKANINENEFRLLLDFIFDNVKIKFKEMYVDRVAEALQMISDKDDAPFLALALAVEADGIWSDDKHFLEQDKVKIFSTKKMVKML
jgi:predicted nucleic acid-binding protein